MNIPDDLIRPYLFALVIDQQATYGGQLNALALAVRGRTRAEERAALLMLVCVAVNAKPALPASRWLPGLGDDEDRAHKFFRAIRDVVYAFNHSQKDAHSLLERLDTTWRLL
jgi:hypothetical protein